MVLRQILRSFIEEERRIIEENGWKFQQFKVFVRRIQEDTKRDPRRYRLGEKRVELFDKAARQLVGRRLRDGRIIVGFICHDKTLIDIMEHIDRSMVVVGPKGHQVYHLNITGPKWIGRHLKMRPNVWVVPVQVESEREGLPEEISIPKIKECIVGFIESDPN